MATRRPTRVPHRMPRQCMPASCHSGQRTKRARRMWVPLRRHRDSISLGQSVVEFALILPVLMLIFLVALDFGRLFFSYIQVTNAAREAASNAALEARNVQNGTLTAADYYAGIVTAATQETNVQGQQGATAAIAVSSPTCFTPAAQAISCASAPQDSTTATGIGNTVRVTVTQPFSFLTPLIGNVFGGSLNLTASATAPVLNPMVASVIGQPTPTPTHSPTPTPTPSPTPTPTPTPSGAPTPTPTPTPTPAPTPTPTPMCIVPNFINAYWADIGANNTWAGAGFTGTLSFKGGNESKVIQSQSLEPLASVACTSDMQVSHGNDLKYP